MRPAASPASRCSSHTPDARPAAVRVGEARARAPRAITAGAAACTCGASSRRAGTIRGDRRTIARGPRRASSRPDRAPRSSASSAPAPTRCSGSRRACIASSASPASRATSGSTCSSRSPNSPTRNGRPCPARRKPRAARGAPMREITVSADRVTPSREESRRAVDRARRRLAEAAVTRLLSAIDHTGPQLPLRRARQALGLRQPALGLTPRRARTATSHEDPLHRRHLPAEGRRRGVDRARARAVAARTSRAPASRSCASA